MQGDIKEQMNRYPIFSCNEVIQINESQLFKDEQLYNNNRKLINSQMLSHQKKNQTIVNIYDRIIKNNANDPLFPKRQKVVNPHYSTINSARNSKKSVDRQSSDNSTINKFVGEFAKSLSRQQSKSTDLHKAQKISLLRRIIQHYNIKSVEKKYYSNLIKSFGLKIQSFDNTEIVVKKNIHPRQNNLIKLKERVNSEEKQDIRLNTSLPKKPTHRKFKQSTSFTASKKYKGDSQLSRQFTPWPQKQKQQEIQAKIKTRKSLSRQNIRKSMQISQRLVQKPLKMQNSTSNIQTKINKYRQFLFLINFSNCLYRDLDVQRYQTTFKYYIGKGNNGNLIKSVMKKRFWFEQVSKPEEANFIWTQIKLDWVFNQQSSGQKSEDIQQKLIKSIDLLTTKQQQYNETIDIDRDNENVRHIEKVQHCLKISGKKKRRQEIKHLQLMKRTMKVGKGGFVKFSKNKANAKSHEPIDPELKIASLSNIKQYNEIKEGLLHKSNLKFADRLKFTKIQWDKQIQKTLIQNHLPLNGLLGNKKAMYYNIRQFCKLTNKSISDYVPMTFHIKNGLLDPEYKQMAKIFNERKSLKQPNYWIIKPGEYSNRGQGISCTNKLEDIRKRIAQSKQISNKNKSSQKKNKQQQKQATLIVQLYISNPMLYNYRKFDIRVFMMITISNGRLKGYWYQEGYVRTSSFVWTLSQIQDKYIHLTNDAVQKTCEEYGLFEPGNKISYNQLQRYFHTLPAYGRNLDFFGVIYPKMRSIASDLIRSTYLNLDKDRKRDNFQILGLDFMIDNDFKPWLIQVNTNPCLELSAPILERIIPNMIENAFRITIDPLFPPPSLINHDYKFAIPENAVHYNKFELIFDENQQGENFKKLYKDSNIMQQLDDVQEDQQLFEEQGDILNLTDL